MGKGDNPRPVHKPTFDKNFDAIKFCGNSVGTHIIIYRNDGTKEIVTNKRTVRASYDSTMDRPLKDRVLDAYKKVESEGKLTGKDNTKKFAEFTKRVWNDTRLDSE